MLTPAIEQWIFEVGGEAMLARCREMEAKEAKAHKTAPGDIGTAHKVNVDAQRLADLFAVGDSLKLRRDYIVKFVEFLGVDKAEAGLLILAGENPDAPLKSGKSLVDQLIPSSGSKNRVFASSLVEQMTGGK